MSETAIVGALLGTAVGDALGLPYEGLSPRRAARLWGEPDRYRLLPGRGMVSDDTEHACMAAQALIACGGDPDRFDKHFARNLRWWILGAPAGVGLATLRASLKLWLGFGPARSGVFSAGNGPSMRSAILGAALDDFAVLTKCVKSSARITHCDPKAEHGALAVALAAHMAATSSSISGTDYLNAFSSLVGSNADDFVHLVRRAVDSANREDSTAQFAKSLGLQRGVSGYTYHTVPVALHAWLRHPKDFRTAVVDVIRCGGDTDTTAAIVGGIVGASVGKAGIPNEWLAGLWEWPRTIDWMDQLGQQLHKVLRSGRAERPHRLRPWGVIPRNAVFAGIVLTHGVRRLLPPY